MADRVPTRIHLGGLIPAAAVPELLAAIADDAPALDWGDNPFRPETVEELLEAADQDGTLELVDDQGTGSFDLIEACCRRHGIGYDRACDARYEYDGWTECYRPGMATPRGFHSTQDGRLLVPVDDLAQVADALRQGLALLAAHRLVLLCGADIPLLEPLRLASPPPAPEAPPPETEPDLG